MLVAAVAIDLAANFATRPSCAVHVDIRSAGTYGSDQLVDFSGIEALITCCLGRRDVWTNVGCDDRARDGCGRRGTRLGTRRTIAEIGAEKHGDTTVYPDISNVNMGLLHSPFKIGIAEFPVDARFIVADPCGESTIAGCETADGVSS